ncbi:MAG: D-alanyl-D-alanine carboxypeptidase family protein, partial [Dehalococcoidia bacterium]
VVAARPTQGAERTAPKVSAAAAVVIDEDSAAVLFGKNEDERRAPASLTKVATAALAVQSGALDETVHNTVDSARMPGSSLMGLKPGDEFSLRDLLYGLILPSGNDAAIAIGRYLGDGSDAAFMYQVNALFESLGLDGSHFTDPHGLGGRYHYTTATELALLSRYAMQFPEFRDVVAARSWTAEGSRTIQLSNLNPFMDVYPGADGLKTGYTEVAGPTFIGSAERDGRRLYVVLLNSQDRFGEASALLDWAFETYDWSEADPARGMRTILNEGDLP